MNITLTFDPNDENDVITATSVMRAFNRPEKASIVEQHNAEMVTAPTTVHVAEAPVDAPGASDPQIGVELDVNGTPWLADVHAGTKSKKADGSWTRRKGVQESTQLAAEKAAREKLAGTPPAPELPPVTAPEPVVTASAGMPGMPGMAAIPTAAPVSYEQLVEKYGQLAAANLITPDAAMAIYAAVGVDVASLATNETGRAAVYAEMCKLG